MLLKALIKAVIAIVVAVVIVVVAIVTGGGGGSPGSQTRYGVGGTVSGLTGTLVLRNNGGNDLTLTSNGSFAFGNKIVSGGTYSVTVLTQPSNQLCTVTHGSGTVSSNVTSVAVDCVNAYTVSVAVSGLQGSGLVLGNGTDSLPVHGNSYFTFPMRVADGTLYRIAVLVPPASPKQFCTVTGGSGTVSGANVTNPQVHCISQITGVAAVGLPLVGEVTIKDAVGTVRTVTTDLDGGYAIDVSDLVAPFVFRATGKAGGTTYTIHSAAVAADVGGNISITPLTDLMVCNIAHQLASNYFSDPLFAATLTPEALAAEAELLKQRLLPVLRALGVEASADLLRTPFTPLASALDAALEVLRVSVDPATHIATITNIVSQQKIFDDILQPASVEYGAPVMDQDGNLDVVATDMAEVRATLEAFAALYATGLPSLATAQALLDDDFRHADDSGSNFARALTGLSGFVGGSVTDLEITDVAYDGPVVTATVDFTLRGANGGGLYRLESFKLRKHAAGTWLLLGDQRVLDLEVNAVAEWWRGNRTAYFNCMLTGLRIHVTSDDPDNDGGTIDRVGVYGPGLPGGELMLSRSSNEPYRFVLPPATSPFIGFIDTYFMGFRCGNSAPVSAIPDATIAAIPDNAGYLVVAYTSTGSRISLPGGWVKGGTFANGMTLDGAYLLHVPKRPVTVAEGYAALPSLAGVPPTVPGLWPFITAPVTMPNYSVGGALALYSGGVLTVSAAGMNPGHYVDVDLSVRAQGTEYSIGFDDAFPNAGGLFTTTIDLAVPAAPGPCDIRRLEVKNTDPNWREFSVITEASPQVPFNGVCPAP